MTIREKNDFIQTLSDSFRPFWDEIDLSKIIFQIDWNTGFTILNHGDEELILRMIKLKGWEFDNREKLLKFDGSFPILKTKFYWKQTGGYFYFLLTNGINLDFFQQKLHFEPKEIKETR